MNIDGSKNANTPSHPRNQSTTSNLPKNAQQHNTHHHKKINYIPISERNISTIKPPKADIPHLNKVISISAARKKDSDYSLELKNIEKKRNELKKTTEKDHKNLLFIKKQISSLDKKSSMYTTKYLELVSQKIQLEESIIKAMSYIDNANNNSKLQKHGHALVEQGKKTTIENIKNNISSVTHIIRGLISCYKSSHNTDKITEINLNDVQINLKTGHTYDFKDLTVYIKKIEKQGTSLVIDIPEIKSIISVQSGENKGSEVSISTGLKLTFYPPVSGHLINAFSSRLMFGALKDLSSLNETISKMEWPKGDRTKINSLMNVSFEGLQIKKGSISQNGLTPENLYEIFSRLFYPPEVIEPTWKNNLALLDDRIKKQESSTLKDLHKKLKTHYKESLDILMNISTSTTSTTSTTSEHKKIQELISNIQKKAALLTETEDNADNKNPEKNSPEQTLEIINILYALAHKSNDSTENNDVKQCDINLKNSKITLSNSLICKLSNFKFNFETIENEDQSIDLIISDLATDMIVNELSRPMLLKKGKIHLKPPLSQVFKQLKKLDFPITSASLIKITTSLDDIDDVNSLIFYTFENASSLLPSGETTETISHFTEKDFYAASQQTTKKKTITQTILEKWLPIKSITQESNEPQPDKPLGTSSNQIKPNITTPTASTAVLEEKTTTHTSSTPAKTIHNINNLKKVPSGVTFDDLKRCVNIHSPHQKLILGRTETHFDIKIKRSLFSNIFPWWLKILLGKKEKKYHGIVPVEKSQLKWNTSVLQLSRENTYNPLKHLARFIVNISLRKRKINLTITKNTFSIYLLKRSN